MEPYREIFFVDDAEKEVRKDDEFGTRLCGPGDWPSFGRDEISCWIQFDDPIGMSYEDIKINRVSGVLSIVDQHFVGDEASGVVTTQATCLSQQSKLENKF